MNILLLLAGLAVLGFIIWDSVSSRRFERRKAIRAQRCSCGRASLARRLLSRLGGGK